jgi:hypothetical protein
MEIENKYAFLYKRNAWMSCRHQVLNYYTSQDRCYCTYCGKYNNNPNFLQVHHTFYIKGEPPWSSLYGNYQWQWHKVDNSEEDKPLILLCKNCHDQLHNKIKIEVRENPDPNRKKLIDEMSENEIDQYILKLLCDCQNGGELDKDGRIIHKRFCFDSRNDVEHDFENLQILNLFIPNTPNILAVKSHKGRIWVYIGDDDETYENDPIIRKVLENKYNNIDGFSYKLDYTNFGTREIIKDLILKKINYNK